MKLQLISDLHSEFYHPPSKVLERIEIVPDLDFLVIAGDLVVPMRQTPAYTKVFDYFSQKARHIIYVTGNHEFYGGSPGVVEERLRQIMPANFYWLQNNSITLDDHQFYGGTLWFDNADQMNFYFKRYMNDFAQIIGLEPWVYQMNDAFRSGAQELVNSNTIVVSHHLPHFNSTPPQFRGSIINRFFVCDQTKLITERQPRFWLHGHTHHACDYKLGETRVICNPFGYPYEIPGIYPPVVLDI